MTSVVKRVVCQMETATRTSDDWEYVVECALCHGRGPFKTILTNTDIFKTFHRGTEKDPWCLLECSCGCRFISPRWSMAYYTRMVQEQERQDSVKSWASRCYEYGNFYGDGGGVPPAVQKSILHDYYANTYREVRGLIRSGAPCVLDAGSNVAWALKTFVELGCDRDRSIATDLEPEACRITREKFGLRSLCVDLPTLTLPDRFDFIHCNDYIEHAHDPMGSLRTLRRLAKDGAVLWLKTFAEDLDEKAGRTMLAPYGHLFHFTSSVLRRSLEAAGWFPIRWYPTAGVQYVFICLAATTTCYR